MEVLHGTEKPEVVDAVRWTRDLAEAAARENDAKLPAAKRKEWADFKNFMTDDDGPRFGVVDIHGDHADGRYGVWVEREQTFKALFPDAVVVNYERDNTYDVLTEDDFQARYNVGATKAGAAK